MTKRTVGGNSFRAQIDEVRMSTTAIRKALNIIIEGSAGPSAIVALAAKIALETANITDAINTIENIGEKAKNERTK